MWFTEDFAGSLGAITDAGVVKHYPTGNKLWRPNTIVVGWAGKVAEYTKGLSPSPHIRGLVLGPDGNVWFTDSEQLMVTGAVGRITPGGKVTLFRKGLAKGAGPSGITVGPDRNLWFTENAGGPHIGRITTAGKITLYKIPLPSSYTATAIARGQGRHLWVASNGLPGLVRVTVP